MAGCGSLSSVKCHWNQHNKWSMDILLRAVDICLLSVTSVFPRECSGEHKFHGVPINRCYAKNSIHDKVSLGKADFHKLCNTSSSFSYVDLS